MDKYSLLGASILDIMFSFIQKGTMTKMAFLEFVFSNYVEEPTSCCNTMTHILEYSKGKRPLSGNVSKHYLDKLTVLSEDIRVNIVIAYNKKNLKIAVQHAVEHAILESRIEEPDKVFLLSHAKYPDPTDWDTATFLAQTLWYCMQKPRPGNMRH
jgi:hypothetical protein